MSDLNDKLLYLNENITDRELLVKTGFKVLNGSSNLSQQCIGISYLERSLDKKAKPKPFSINEPQGKILAMWCGRFYYQQGNYTKAEKLINLAATSTLEGDDAAIQQATLQLTLAAHSTNSDESEEYLCKGNILIEKLLNKKDLNLSTVRDPTNDHYVYCLFSSFYLETLYEADWKNVANSYYKLAIKAWPALNYTNIKKEKPKKIIKIGIVSPFLHKSNSVIRDFGETLKRLPKDKFSLHLIYLKEQNLPISEDCKSWNALSEIIEVKNEINPLSESGIPKWLFDTRLKVANMKLDMILYLDLTMSPMAHRLAMSRLAPIQLTSHGHPVTSGINTIDYYISWQAAEIENAQQHYVEKLVLLPSKNMHQYHNPVFVNGKSTINGEIVPIGKREELFPNIKGGKRWYVCMQKPFKLHACFGNILKQILEKDPDCVLILHSGAERWNLNNEKVIYLNPLPHHILLALYRDADIVLDSYYAGGCTTSREAFEMNSVVVTLPAKYLGGRWSFAFYNILGVFDAVAKDINDYVKLVINIGKNISLRNTIKSKIANNLHKMFKSEEAVENWTKVLLNIANKN